MRKYLISISMLAVLCACSEESKVKEIAVDGAKERFKMEIKAEFAKAVIGKPHIQATAVRILTEKSDFDVQKLEINSDRADVLVQVLTTPVKARTALMDVMEKLDERKEARFNVSDALTLILQQMNLTETRSLIVYKMKLEKNDGWQLTKDKK